MEELLCRDRAAWREWLVKNGDRREGVWLVFGKTDDLETVTAAEALREALCFGWIDGQIKRIDDTRYIKKFTPRRKGSKWSEKNRRSAAALIKAGRMTVAGYAAIERAKADGTWDTPKPPPITDEQVAVLTEALTGHEPARTNFLKMPPSARRAYAGFYLDAKKEETRARRLTRIAARLDENKKLM